jgi:hypothetical protein
LKVLLLSLLCAGPLLAADAVWNATPVTPIPADFAPSGRVTQAQVSIFGPRGGQAAGQVVVISDSPVRASVGELTGPAGKITGAVVRYASSQADLVDGKNPKLMPYCDSLSPTPLPDQRVQPVWVIVEIPATAAPGIYTGMLSTSGGAVPVRLHVTAFTMPASAHRRNWLGLVQGIDSVSDRYDAPLYSDRHFALLEKNLGLLGKLGQNVLLIPVIEQNFGGVTRGLITFTQRGQELEPDFSAFDKYLALHIKHCGIPRVAIIELWQVYMALREGEKIEGRDKTQAVLSVRQGTAWETASVPLYPANAAFWTKLYTATRERLLKAGVPAAGICLGFYSDRRPSEEQIAFWRQVDPELGWAGYTHGYGGFTPPGNAKVTYCEIPDARPGDFPLAKPFPMKLGWNPTGPFVTSVRGWNEDRMVPMAWRMLPDAALGKCQTGASKGIGRVGFDAWDAPSKTRDGQWYSRMDPNGTLYSKHGRLIRGNSRAIIAPGKEGAIPTVRYLMFREGLQDVEARAAIEAVVLAGKADAAFVEQANKVLADWWVYLKQPGGDKMQFTQILAYGERWEERTLALHALAAKAP